MLTIKFPAISPENPTEKTKTYYHTFYNKKFTPFAAINLNPEKTNLEKILSDNVTKVNYQTNQINLTKAEYQINQKS